MAEDKHFVAHPEGGVTTEAALAEAEKAKTEGAAGEEVKAEESAATSTETSGTDTEKKDDESTDDSEKTEDEDSEKETESKESTDAEKAEDPGQECLRHRKVDPMRSQGVNITTPDLDGRLSIGILQYHLGPLNTEQSSTWELFSKASGLKGSPAIQSDAIRMTDWAINNGLGPHWTCWKIEHL
jgi:hypothetical protein